MYCVRSLWFAAAVRVDDWACCCSWRNQSSAAAPASVFARLGLCLLESETLSELLFGHLLKPLVRRFTDPSEVCREQAVLLLIKFLAHVRFCLSFSVLR